MQDGSPAHAGIDPAKGPGRAAPAWFPRTRGDRPSNGVLIIRFTGVPPHTRG